MGKLLPLIFYYQALIYSFFLRLKLVFKNDSNPRHKSTIVISASPKGHELIELKEILQSAREFGGITRVITHTVDRTENFVTQLKKCYDSTPFTHILFDPRSGRAESDQNLNNAIIDSFQLLAFVTFHKIIPIVYLTDVSMRNWRIQAAIVTCRTGIVVNFMHPSICSAIFPHSRLLGPIIMPISIKTFKKNSKHKNKSNNSKPKALFIGSTYEPRKTFLNQLKSIVGPDLTVNDRKLGSRRIDNDKYWQQLIEADIVITTCLQMNGPNRDMTEYPQLVYRFLEVMSCGTLLMAPNIPGANRYFRDGEHFVLYENLEDAAKKMRYFLDNSDSRLRIAKAGLTRAKNIIESNTFWSQIDFSLGSEGLTNHNF